MKKHIVVIIIISLVILFSWRICDALTSFYIFANYKELKPLPPFVDVLYKGLKIGRVVSSKHSDDFEHTTLKLKIYPKNIVIPENVIALLKIEKRRLYDYDYIELIKPESPSPNKLVAGMIIEGHSMVDTKSYFANQKLEELDKIKDNLYQASEDLVTTIEGMSALFSMIQDVISSNEENLKRFTNGIANSAGNVNRFTSTLNSAVTETRLESSLTSLNSSLQNLNEATDSLSATLPDLLQNATGTVENINEITQGVSDSLTKPFGGLRLLFGRSGKGRCGSR